ncbi:MAG: LPP20 family lipoprotein [Candidatus Cloacimonetes bacterium]|nr:LPP20 family lipoprotein [Candidatus Cloacimonadota bacterium]
MKKTIILIFAVLLILSCASTQKTVKPPKIIKYPQWFITPHNAVIGYGPIYFTEESSAKAATQKATDNYIKFSHCLVLGTQTYIQSVKGLDLVYDSLFIHIEASPAEEGFLEKQFAHADTFATDNMIIVIHSNTSLSGMKDIIQFPDECVWVTTPPQDKEFLYAVGSCNSIYSEHKAWESAENNAILNLARKISLNNAVETLVNDEILMSKFDENVNVELRDIEVVERWKDPRTNSYCVLIRM